MPLFHVIVLGIVQGLSEFLPISSSAHLTLVPWIMRWPDPGQAYDTALHLGSLLAILAVFGTDWIKLAASGLKGTKTAEGRLFWSLLIACIPGAVAGVILDKYAQFAFRSPLVIAINLIVMGFVLYIADAYGSKKAEMDSVTPSKGFIIGLFQSLAIVPGVSRSGITMTSGLFFGMNREAAARFSFLLATPTIFGDGLLKLKDIVKLPGAFSTPFFIGIFVSAFVGFLVIRWMLDLINKVGYKPFAWYRFAVGLLVIITWVTR